jgi:hypothetical protein
MYIKIIENIMRSIENLVSKGDKYYNSALVFTHILNIIYLVVFSIFGISLVRIQMIRGLNTLIQTSICILLLIKYHPYREHVFTQSDAKLIFSCAVFLFFNLGLVDPIDRINPPGTPELKKAIANINKHISGNALTEDPQPEHISNAKI